MDWQVRGLSILGLGFLANESSGVFSPVVQAGALGILAILLVMNYKGANADRAARAATEEAERAVRLKHEEHRTERDRLRLEAMQKLHAETIAALERAYEAKK